MATGRFTLPVQSEYIAAPIYQQPWQELYGLAGELNERAAQTRLMEDNSASAIGKIKSSVLPQELNFVEEEQKRIYDNIEKEAQKAGYNPADPVFQSAVRVGGQQIVNSDVFRSKMASRQNYARLMEETEKLRKEGKLNEAQEVLRVQQPFQQYLQNADATSVFSPQKGLYEYKNLADLVGDDLKIRDADGSDYVVERESGDGRFYVTTGGGKTYISEDRVWQALLQRYPELKGQLKDQFEDESQYRYGPQTYEARARQMEELASMRENALLEMQKQEKTGKGNKYKQAAQKVQQIENYVQNNPLGQIDAAFYDAYAQYKEAIEMGDQATAAQLEAQMDELNKQRYYIDSVQSLVGEISFERTKSSQTLTPTAEENQRGKMRAENELLVLTGNAPVQETGFSKMVGAAQEAFQTIQDGGKVPVRGKEISKNEAYERDLKTGLAATRLKPNVVYDENTGKYYEATYTKDKNAVIKHMRETGQLDVLDKWAKLNGVNPSQFKGGAPEMYANLAQSLEEFSKQNELLFNTTFSIIPTDGVGNNSPVMKSAENAIASATQVVVVSPNGNREVMSIKDLTKKYNDENGTKYTPEQLKQIMTKETGFDLVTGYADAALNPQGRSGFNIGKTLGNDKVYFPASKELSARLVIPDVLDQGMFGTGIFFGKTGDEVETVVSDGVRDYRIYGNTLEGKFTIDYLNQQGEIVRTEVDRTTYADFKKSFINGAFNASGTGTTNNPLSGTAKVTIQGQNPLTPR